MYTTCLACDMVVPVIGASTLFGVMDTRAHQAFALYLVVLLLYALQCHLMYLREVMLVGVRRNHLAIVGVKPNRKIGRGAQCLRLQIRQHIGSLLMAARMSI